MLAVGCRSVSVRGVVETVDEHPVAKAVVTLQPEGADAHAVTALSDPNGCFDLFQTIPQHHGDYHLLVDLPGYKPLSIPVAAGPDNLLLLMLEPATGGGSSTARPISSSERYLRYATPCESLVHAASSLTLH